MRVLVCGGRDYSDVSRLYGVLDALPRDGLVIIHGGARGADSLAAEWAKDRQVSSHAFPANWTEHGRAAGPIRNQTMIDLGKPDCVIAFPGGRGTFDMIDRAKKAGIAVTEVPHDDDEDDDF